MTETAPARLRAFLNSAPRGSLRVLKALSAAESLNDLLAKHLQELVCPGQVQLEDIVPALHLAGFVVERNSEWHLAYRERRFLSDELVKDVELFRICHTNLAELAQLPVQSGLRAAMPTYLVGPVGKAYHLTAVSPAEGLPLYQAAYSGRMGERWLAARLATEQQEQNVVPSTAIEPAFLRGMVLYREGRLAKAMRALEPVAFSEAIRFEVAVAAHLFGRNIRLKDPLESERLLRRSLEIGVQIGDAHHQAQVLHTLGQQLWDRNDAEAESMLKKSLAILEDFDDVYGQAQVLHSLGQRIWGRDPNAGEVFLKGSLVLLEKINERPGPVLHTLGQLVWDQDPIRGEQLLKQSLVDREESRDRHSEALVLHSLGQRLWDKDPATARQMLERSIGILTATYDRFGVAQVLHTLGQKLANIERSTAEMCLRQSLAIGEELGNLRHQAMALLALGTLVWDEDPEEGLAFLNRSLDIERHIGSRFGERLVRRELERRGVQLDGGE